MGLRIDPEVAALLDDLPPITLPPALVAEGWGQRSLKDHNVGRQEKPSEVQQPTYKDHCVQCGRPVTMSRRQFWTDHAGRVFCENVLLDKPVLEYHVTQADYDVIVRDPYNIIRQEVRAPESKLPAAKCSATKHRATHVHRCEHPGGHFGFHECIECRHLWR